MNETQQRLVRLTENVAYHVEETIGNDYETALDWAKQLVEELRNEMRKGK
jgi:hypothetical protein